MKKIKKHFLTMTLGIVLLFGVYNCASPQAQTDNNDISSRKKADQEETLNRCKFYLSNGRQYMIQQSWENAIRNFKQVIEKGLAEEFADPLFKDLAQSYMKLGMPDSAAYYIEQGLSYKGTDKHMLQLAGYYNERAADYEDALDAYQKYNALYMDDVEYLKKQANLLDEMGRYQDELEVWEYIIEIEPDDDDAINAIIDVLGKMGKDPKDFYKKAWENNTASASRALKYINALLNDNECGEAIRVAKQSLQYNPSNETLVKKLAQAYEYNNQMLEALKALEDYARKNPRDINMQIDVALKNLDFENYQKAYNIISNAIKVAPQNKEVYAVRGKILEQFAETVAFEKNNIDVNDRIVYHMAYEDYQKSRELGNFNAQFRIKYLYDNDLTIAKPKERFLVGDANKVGDNTFKALGEEYSWLDRTVTVE
ncbi:MAG: hypothetical protein R6V48_07765 [Fidelibacterota bacterium]